jgi:hypothetical protein
MHMIDDRYWDEYCDWMDLMEEVVVLPTCLTGKQRTAKATKTITQKNGRSLFPPQVC